MPKRRAGHSRGKQEAKALARRERKSGLYLSPGDPDFKSLSEQLRVQGLALRDVAGDGNCLFRALAEQLDHHHSNLRSMAVKHIRANSGDYAPFLDEDTSFESYVDELSKDGTYAGNDAIVAVSRSCGVNVVIHQLGAPRWEVRAPPAPREGAVSTVHIAYLRGEHYCSVCPLHGQALPKVEEVKQEIDHSSAVAKPKPFQEKCAVQCVLEATGCEDEGLAEQCLRESAGEINLAIVEMLQLMALKECDTAGGCSGELQVEKDLQLKQSKTTTSPPARHVSKSALAQRHLSNRERKEAAKAARKEAARETKRQHKAAHEPSGKSHTDSGARTI